MGGFASITGCKFLSGRQDTPLIFRPPLANQSRSELLQFDESDATKNHKI